VGTFKASNSSSSSAWQLILPTFQIAFSGFLRKGAQVRTGAIDSTLIAPKLIEMVSTGKAKPSFIVSSIISLEEAPQFYERASRHLETKVVIKFSS
jgi:threonine dehydrogenase-like Zn-dependent dehydrogenase